MKKKTFPDNRCSHRCATAHRPDRAIPIGAVRAVATLNVPGSAGGREWQWACPCRRAMCHGTIAYGYGQGEAPAHSDLADR